MTLINTVENSLMDLKNKGNLDIALETYNPNNFFKKVFHVTYNPADLQLNTNNGVKVICPFYFKILFRCKSNKVLKGILYPFAYVAHIVYIAYFIWKKDIDIARGRMPYLMSLALAIASKINRIPFTVSLGGNNRLAQEKIGKYHLFNNRSFSFFIEELVINIASLVIVPNIYTKKYVQNISRQNSIEVNPLPIRKLFFDSLDEVNEHREDYFLFVGRLVGDKHPDFIMSVFKKYIEKTKNKNMLLKYVGNGNMLVELQEQASKLRLSSRVEFVGFAQPNDIKKYIKKAKVSLIPVSGFVIYESAVFGNPIITSDIEWHAEFIINEKNGWVCKYLDVEQWVDTLSRIVDDYDRALRVAAKLKDDIKLLDPREICKREIKIYKSLME